MDLILNYDILGLGSGLSVSESESCVSGNIYESRRNNPIIATKQIYSRIAYLIMFYMHSNVILLNANNIHLGRSIASNLYMVGRNPVIKH